MDTQRDMSGKVAVVTGANSGIGLVAARNFARRGADVVIVCRNADRAQLALAELRAMAAGGRVEAVFADFSCLADVGRLGAQLAAAYPKVHLLCNNAGAANERRQVTPEGFELTFAANHLAGYLLTRMLMPALLAAATDAPARIIFTSSYGHNSGPLDFDDLNMVRGYRGLKAYGRSKLMNLLTAMELHRRFGDQGLVASSFHPGAVRTPIWSKGGWSGRILGLVLYPFMVSVETGAETLIWLATSNHPDAVAAAGRYFYRCRPGRTAAYATDEAAARLWSVSETLVAPYGPFV